MDTLPLAVAHKPSWVSPFFQPFKETFMSRSTFKSLVLGFVVVPLVLGLAACSKDEAGSTGLSGDPIAKIAPPVGKAWTDIVARTVDGGYRMGNPDAPIKLIEYGSLSCPHCARFGREGFPELTSQFVASGRVSFEFRSFAIHPQDLPLTVLMRCSTLEAAIPLAEQVYANFDSLMARIQQGAGQAQAAMTQPEDKRFVALADVLGITEFFAQRGIPVDQANACLANPAAATEVAKQSEKYSEQGISSTPTFQINGVTEQANTWADLKPRLEALGAR